MNEYPNINRLTIIKEYITGIYRTKNDVLEHIEEKIRRFSAKTIERDFQQLREIGCEIEYTRERGYTIKRNQEFENELLNRFGEVIRLKQRFDKESEVLDYILDTSIPMEGIDLLPELFLALKNKRFVQFDYVKHGSPKKSTRKIIPLWLKESEDLWYLIAVIPMTGDVRTFGLDRIHNLQLLETYEDNLITEKVTEQVDNFKFMIGVTKPLFGDFNKCYIELGVSNFLLDYWKKKPIHISQKITDRKIKELTADGYQEFTIVEFYLIPNISLLKMIVSGLGEIKPIGPKKLKEYIKTQYFYRLKSVLD